MVADAAAKDAEYAEMLAAVKEAYGDKYLSIVGDSISTYGGINNNTDYNLTIGSNAIHYPSTDSNLTGYEQTYWGRLLVDLDMNLAVNNSWSGSTAYASNTSGIVYRSNQLHRDGGTSNTTADDIAPDVIIVYLGINDIHTDQPVGDLYTILNTNDGRTDKEKVAAWFTEVQQKYERDGNWSDWFAAYAIALSNMKANYGDAEIWCINHMQQNDYRSTDDEIELANRCIGALVEYFEINLIDQTTENEVNTSNCHIYTNDWNCLHPNALGHEKMEEMIVRAMYKKLMAQ